MWPPYSVIVPYYIVCIVKYFKSSAKLFNLKSINSKYSKRGLKKREEKQKVLILLLEQIPKMSGIPIISDIYGYFEDNKPE